MRLLLFAAAAVFAANGAGAEPLALSATPLSGFSMIGDGKEFGKLSWRGGLVLTADDSEFGGLSGLALTGDCRDLLAVSDAGRWFKARLSYDSAGNLEAAAGGEIAPILDANGKPPKRKIEADAEALASIGGGKLLVGFESLVRVGLYDIGKRGLEARFELVKSPKAITEGPANAELEAIGRLAAGPYAGYFIAISENQRDNLDNIKGWLWKGAKTVPFTVKRLEDYAITDLAVLPDGDVVILERSFSNSSLPGMALRRFSTKGMEMGSLVEPDLIFSGRLPLYAIDNMEGLAICERNGETRLTLVSDNNFNTTLQRTLLLQFAYEP